MAAGTSDRADDRSLSISEAAIAFGLPISTLRYYDKIGLVPASHRRSTIRYYDHVALRRLVYVQLWHSDGNLSIDQTDAILASRDRAQRDEVIHRSRKELADRIARLVEAHDMLSHMTNCPYDDHLACPITSTYLGERVDAGFRRLAGHGELTAEAPVSALYRVKAALESPGTTARTTAADT